MFTSPRKQSLSSARLRHYCERIVDACQPLEAKSLKRAFATFASASKSIGPAWPAPFFNLASSLDSDTAGGVLVFAGVLCAGRAVLHRLHHLCRPMLTWSHSPQSHSPLPFSGFCCCFLSFASSHAWDMGSVGAAEPWWPLSRFATL